MPCACMSAATSVEAELASDRLDRHQGSDRGNGPFASGSFAVVFAGRSTMVTAGGSSIVGCSANSGLRLNAQVQLPTRRQPSGDKRSCGRKRPL